MNRYFLAVFSLALLPAILSANGFRGLRRVPEGVSCTYSLRVGDIADDKAVGKVRDATKRPELYDAIIDGCEECIRAGEAAIAEAFRAGNNLVRTECTFVGCETTKGATPLILGSARFAKALSLSKDRSVRAGCRFTPGEKR